MLKRILAVSAIASALATGVADAQTYAPVPVYTDTMGITRPAQGVKEINPAGVITAQVKISVTGTAVCFPSATLYNGVVVKGLSTNAANGTVGTSTVTNTADGTGNGAIIEPGTGVSLGVVNLGTLCVNGTAGDIYFAWGN